VSLGPAEILVILLVALVVFGPKRLPEVGKQVGGAMRELRKMQDSMKSELSSVLDMGGSDSSRQEAAPSYDEVQEIPAGEGDRDHDEAPRARPTVSHLDDPDDGPSGSFS
jgi:TatA/E family protein of Tat protein translocase